MPNFAISEFPVASPLEVTDEVVVQRGGASNFRASISQIINAHGIADHPDTDATGTQLNTLTNGSNADALHGHAAVASHTIASHSDTAATGTQLNTLTDGSNADALHNHSSLSGAGTQDRVPLWTPDGITLGNSRLAQTPGFMNLLSGAFVVDVGPLGVGVAAPLGMLHVRTAAAGLIVPDADADDFVLESDGNTGMTIYSAVDGKSSIYAGDSSDDDVGFIEFDHDTNRWSMGVGGGVIKLFELTSSGHRLGAGGPQPILATTLHLQDVTNPTADAVHADADNLVISSDNNVGITLLTDNNRVGSFFFADVNTRASGFRGLDGNLEFWSGSASRMLLNSIGHFTIFDGATITAGGLLVTAGGATITAGGLLISAGNFQATAAEAAIGRTVIAGVRLALQNTDAFTTDIMRIIQGGAGDVPLAFVFSQAGPTDWMIGGDHSANAFNITPGITNLGVNPAFSLTATRNLGIDITPTVKLDVGGKSGKTVTGGDVIKLTNKTGSNSVRGQLVSASPTTSDAFATAAASSTTVIGVIYESGVPDGSEAWVVVSGIGNVLMDTGGAALDDRIGSSATPGSADVINSPDPTNHFREIGHCIEAIGGAGVTRCVIHLL